jgi:hypothetical protein
MRMTEPNDEEYFKWLKQEIRLAFFQNTGRKLRATPSKDNPYFELLYKDIVNELDLKGNAERQPPKVGTLIKLLCSTATDFIPANSMILEDYVFSVKEKFKSSNKSANNTIVYDVNLRGAKIINSVFRDQFSEDRAIERSDFYLGKTSNGCQWYGVIRNWDIKRGHLEEIVDYCLNCFNWESKITAVIIGSGGCGKSIFLRRVAIELIDAINLRVLWINDLETFYKEAFENVIKSFDKFLIIIDDWTSIASDIHLITKFLNKLHQSENVRLIVGDRKNLRQKQYRKYLIPGNEFELSALENKDIISSIIKLNKPWQNIDITGLKSGELSRAPLFILIFIIASENSNSEKPPIITDALSQFRDIIYHDYIQIRLIYPGLARAIYYWAKMQKENRVILMWEFFLALVERFCRSKDASQRIKAFDSLDPICNILSRYFSLEQLVHPQYNECHFMISHHDLLIDEGLIYVADDDNFWNDLVKCEIVYIACFCNLHYIASQLTMLFRLVDSEELPERDKKYLSKLLETFVPNYSINLLNQMAIDVYAQAEQINDEKSWQDLITFLLFLTFNYADQIKYVSGIFKKLIENGCNSISIKGVLISCSTTECFFDMAEVYLIKLWYLNDDFHNNRLNHI